MTSVPATVPVRPVTVMLVSVSWSLTVRVIPVALLVAYETVEVALLVWLGAALPAFASLLSTAIATASPTVSLTLTLAVFGVPSTRGIGAAKDANGSDAIPRPVITPRVATILEYFDIFFLFLFLFLLCLLLYIFT